MAPGPAAVVAAVTQIEVQAQAEVSTALLLPLIPYAHHTIELYNLALYWFVIYFHSYLLPFILSLSLSLSLSSGSQVKGRNDSRATRGNEPKGEQSTSKSLLHALHVEIWGMIEFHTMSCVVC